MSDQKQGESVSFDPSEAVRSAPSAKGSGLGPKGKPMEQASEEKASKAPSHKGAQPSHEGVPATDPAPHAAPFDSSKSELDGHALKKPSQRK